MTASPPPRTARWWSLVLPLLAVAVVSVATLAGGAEPSAPEARPAAGVSWRVIAWNDLGMHCIDPDFSVFSILPPFNTLNAHVIQNGQLVDQAGGLTVTFEGIPDATGSINTTSAGKTNFWQHVADLFGASPPVDTGLTGTMMPGLANVPQPMGFDGGFDWFQGEGIPVTPFDDALQKNPYPLMRVVVRSAGGQELASTVTVVPNSQELECRSCHASGASPYAAPAAGWAFDPDPLRDDRLNILRLHDERHLGQADYDQALLAAGYDAAGLHHTAVNLGVSVLCANCHGSNALIGTGLPGITPLTQAIHGGHADARIPDGRTLDEISTRDSCFLCHPGRDTQCLRGAMGTAIGADGQHSMHCQSCHGDMSTVGDPARVGWLDQPTCQNCHVGTATQNPGSIRLLSAVDAQGDPNVPTTTTFATEPDAPAAGLSLYRFSRGHGGLQCSACHGPPHAIYPTRFDNDNVQNQLLQGHEGTLTDCRVCHDALEDDEYEGPHGMHPIDYDWAHDDHGDAAQANLDLCRSCHGQDLLGTELSRVQGPRSFSLGSIGNKSFWRGFQISCYACHEGPGDSDPVANADPAVPDRTLAAVGNEPLPVTLTGTDADGDPLTFRIISQPDHGTVSLGGALATWLPEPGFTGTTSFTYAAWDGKVNSNLGTVTLNVGPPACAGTIESYGFGHPGSGDALPQLEVTGCPESQGSLTLTIDDALGGTVGILAVGTSRAVSVTPFDCVLRVGGAVIVTPPFPLPGTGPGGGALTVQVTLPAGLPAGTITLQAFILDPGASAGLAATGGVELTLP